MRTCSHAAFEGAEGGIQFGLHAAGSDAIGDQPPAFGGGEDGADLLGAIHDAIHVGEEDELVGAERGGAGDGHLIGIDVVDVALSIAGDAGDDGDVAVGGQQVQQGGVGTGDAADGAERGIHLLGFDEEAIDAGESDGERAARFRLATSS